MAERNAAMLDGWIGDDGVHRLPVRVYYEDTDAGGIVYHANYLRFMERGRTAMLRLMGLTHRDLADTAGVSFAVRRMRIEFIAPARLDDALEVATRIDNIGGASFAVAQSVRRDDREVASAEVKLALLGPEGRAVRFPAILREALAKHHERQKRD
ncbi:tol-pal system-associated acyl-CoA thioesterase [Azospirillum sp. RWY-5-1]|uniref:Tol-pal system-associated acyl-CoA thioesterase n=1 Tax=Azospirillum oleiclasticum TaxID=2735135 RepID=A0ABX2TC86_9PROT|nr:tol-pal system-associated acyl-CoA thioesterase [Azospirillum oleiclasticum]NYZ14326.1 tol-pal system-associated acyl-CoA thioesterase [Azospirillum oleiclasticum]NYZ21811.1 tol-pal system-associated acyl-CoA thioesterase [Azospirillum oleiclasticum]